MGMRLMVVLKEMSQLRIHGVSNMENPDQILGEKWNNLRDCMKEKWVHLFGFCRLKGKESYKLGLLCGWKNLRAYYPTVLCFRFSLGPVLVDS
jgi:hypothetical protein